MQRELLHHYFGFSHWANEHLLALLSQLPDETLNAENMRFYSGSAWDAVKHLLDVEWSWLRCCRGLDMKPYLWDVHAFGDIREAIAFAGEEYPRVQAYVGALGDDELAEMVNINSGRPDAPPEYMSRGDLLMHILNHSTEHRSDLAHFLTDHNLSPGDLDYLDWVIAHNGQAGQQA